MNAREPQTKAARQRSSIQASNIMRSGLSRTSQTYPAVGIIRRVENKRAQALRRLLLRRRNELHDVREDLLNPNAGLGRREHRVGAVNANDFLDFADDAVRLGRMHVDFVDDWNDFQIVLHGDVRVGERLRLHPLRRVNDEEGALARHQGARHLVREVDVTVELQGTGRFQKEGSERATTCKQAGVSYLVTHTSNSTRKQHTKGARKSTTAAQ